MKPASIVWVSSLVLLLSGCGTPQTGFNQAMGWLIEPTLQNNTTYAKIVELEPSGTASKAGLQVGDVINIESYTVIEDPTSDTPLDAETLAGKKLKSFIVDICERSLSNKNIKEHRMEMNVLRGKRTTTITIDPIPAMSCG